MDVISWDAGDVTVQLDQKSRLTKASPLRSHRGFGGANPHIDTSDGGTDALKTRGLEEELLVTRNATLLDTHVHQPTSSPKEGQKIHAIESIHAATGHVNLCLFTWFLLSSKNGKGVMHTT